MPCGSCAEWLRKIAQVQPDFCIVTFADIGLTSVFVNRVEG